MAEKRGQHRALIAALQEAGWEVDSTAHIVVVGAKGAVYLSGQQALQQLGLTKEQASKLLEDLSVLAVESMYEMTLARRRLEQDGTRVGVG